MGVLNFLQNEYNGAAKSIGGFVNNAQHALTNQTNASNNFVNNNIARPVSNFVSHDIARPVTSFVSHDVVNPYMNWRQGNINQSNAIKSAPSYRPNALESQYSANQNLFKNVALPTAIGTSQAVKDIGQGIARGAAGVSLTLNNMGAQILGNPLGLDKRFTIQPDNPIEKTIFGDRKIRSYGGNVNEYSPWLSKKTGLSQSITAPIVGIGATALDVANLVPGFGEGEKGIQSAAKFIAESKDLGAITEKLASLGVHDRVLADDLVKWSNPKEISKALSSAVNTAKENFNNVKNLITRSENPNEIAQSLRSIGIDDPELAAKLAKTSDPATVAKLIAASKGEISTVADVSKATDVIPPAEASKGTPAAIEKGATGVAKGATPETNVAQAIDTNAPQAAQIVQPNEVTQAIDTSAQQASKPTLSEYWAAKHPEVPMPAGGPEYQALAKEWSQLPGDIKATSEVAPATAEKVVKGETTNTTKQAIETTPKTEPVTQPAAGTTPETTPIDTNAYVKEQTAIQDAARTADKTSLGDKVSAGKEKLKTTIIDKLAPLEDPIRLAQKEHGYEVRPAFNIHYQNDRVIQNDSMSTDFLRGHYTDFNGETHAVSSLNETVANAPGGSDVLDQYLIAKQAIYREGTGIKTGRDLVKDQSLVDQLGPKMEASAQKVYKYAEDLLNYVVDAGLISKDLASKMRAENPEYIPLNRIMEEVSKVTDIGKKGVASLSKQTAVRKIEGSTLTIDSPIESLIKNTKTAFDQGEKNRAGMLLASYRDLPGMKGLIKEVPAGETIGNRNTFSYLDHGIKRTFETTPEIASAARNLDAQQFGVLEKVLVTPARAFRLGTTGINPAFQATNIVKDQVSLAINSDHALQTSVLNAPNFVAAIFSALGHGDLYHEMVSNGAIQTSFDISRNSERISLGKIKASKNAGTKILYTVTHPGEFFRAIENTFGKSEEMTRIQSYRGTRNALIKEGRAPGDARIMAAAAARENTLNFARAGTYGKVANGAVPYLNAGIRGSATIVKNLKERPVQTMSKIAITALFPVASATIWNVSDPARKAAYDDIPEWEKQNGIIIVPPNPTKDAQGRWNVIKIPLSQEIASLTGAVRRPIEAASGLDQVNFGDFASAFFGTVTPFSSVNQLAQTTIPQAAKPSVEGFMNKDFYTGKPIVPTYDTNLPKNMQTNPNVTATATKIGNALGKSPLQTEHWIKGTFGKVGEEALHYGDVAMNKAGMIPDNQVKGTGVVSDVTSRFAKAVGGEQQNRVYDQNNKQNSITSIQNAFKDGKMSEQAAIDAINKLNQGGKQIRLPGNGSMQLSNGKTAVVSNGQVVIGKNLQAAKETQAKNSLDGKPVGSKQTIGDKIFYVKSDGSVGTASQSSIQRSVKGIGLDQSISSAKKNNDLKSLGSYYDQKTKLLQEDINNLDPVVDQATILTKQAQIQKIQDDWAKYQERGYVTKGKSAPKIAKVAVKGIPSTSTPGLKAIKLNVKKLGGTSAGRATTTKQRGRSNPNIKLYH